MKIAISGASGFVGEYLQDYFYARDIEVLPIKREELSQIKILKEKVAQADVIINLAGANIAQYWSENHKKKMYKSRIKSTRALVSAINANAKKQLFISTSAIGIYENNIACNEEDFIYGQTFLTHLCQDWEREARHVKKRMVIFRLGVVLGDGGALKKMLLPFKLGLGGKIGSGEQPFSYIHIEDLIRAYAYVIRHENMQGVFNLTTANPTTNSGFTKALAKRVHKLAFIPLPSMLVKMLFGEGAQVLCEGQEVYPKRLLENGFMFKYSTLYSVLADLV